MAKPFDLAVREWWKVPDVGNSHLADVYATNPGGNQAAVMSAWGGACVDTSRLDLLVWGGGHADYTGNEVYAFEIDNFVWRRKCNPSTPDNDDTETNADGSPASRHTYNGLNYSAARDTMVVAAGGPLAGPTGAQSLVAWEFDCTTETPTATAPAAWTQKDTAPTITPDGAPSPFMAMAYDSASGLYWSQHNRGLLTFDPAAGAGSQWVEKTNFEGPAVNVNPVAVALLSPSQIVWSTAADSGEIFARRLDTFAYIGAEATGLPARASPSTLLNILDRAETSIAWDPELRLMLLWGGTATGGADNRDVYALDVETKWIVRWHGSGDIPDNPAANGTFGRWANLSGCGSTYKGLWLLVNSTTSDVYFYRSWSPAVTKTHRDYSKFPKFLLRG